MTKTVILKHPWSWALFVFRGHVCSLPITNTDEYLFIRCLACKKGGKRPIKPRTVYDRKSTTPNRTRPKKYTKSSALRAGSNSSIYEPPTKTVPPLPRNGQCLFGPATYRLTMRTGTFTERGMLRLLSGAERGPNRAQMEKRSNKP